MRSRLRPALLLAAFTAGLLALASPSHAQEKKDEKKDGLKQKEAVTANLKKADIGTANVVETENFIIATTISKEKAKALGAVLEKVAPVAKKAAQFEEKEEPWKGKLAVYYLPENRDFKSFIRNVVVDQPGSVHYAVRSDTPFLVDPVEVTGKAAEADQFAGTAAAVASAYLKAKGGVAVVPEWLTDGFGRMTAARAEGLMSPRYRVLRTTARTAALGGKGTAPSPLGDLWAEARPANTTALANSFAEYFAYGAGKEKFIAYVNGFRPRENGTVPSSQEALEAAGWKDVAAAETAWRKWAQTGK
jgi:hypothetical protein